MKDNEEIFTKRGFSEIKRLGTTSHLSFSFGNTPSARPNGAINRKSRWNIGLDLVEGHSGNRT
jgi:hypothetical protein